MSSLFLSKAYLITYFSSGLGQVGVINNIIKSHFGLYHPKLCQVAGVFRIFCTECWSESINIAQSHGTQLTFQLTRYGKIGSTTKKSCL
jgi:hypothetical protein